MERSRIIVSTKWLVNGEQTTIRYGSAYCWAREAYRVEYLELIVAIFLTMIDIGGALDRVGIALAKVFMVEWVGTEQLTCHETSVDIRGTSAPTRQ